MKNQALSSLHPTERLSEKPPDYYSLIVTDGEAAPISYEAVLAAKAKEQTAREPIVGTYTTL